MESRQVNTQFRIRNPNPEQVRLLKRHGVAFSKIKLLEKVWTGTEPDVIPAQSGPALEPEAHGLERETAAHVFPGPHLMLTAEPLAHPPVA